jgi:hypothetical protein
VSFTPTVVVYVTEETPSPTAPSGYRSPFLLVVLREKITHMNRLLWNWDYAPFVHS